MTSLYANQSRQFLSYLVFAVVALASVIFWGVELRLSIASHEDREAEVLQAYQQRQLDLKSEGIRDTLQELYQTGRTISLLPAMREATGGNRRSVSEDPVKQGRISQDTYRMLQQIYTNLRANTRVSEVYYVLDGFDFEQGEVPFLMFDDLIAGVPGSGKPGEHQRPKEEEGYEYVEIERQLGWFRDHAPVFRYGNALNAIPAQISPLLRTCDNTQYISKVHGSPRDAAGIVYSIPSYDAQTGRFKGQVSMIVRANIFEARLLDVPFLPITAAEQAQMAAEGWKLPPPSPFVLVEKTHLIEIADRRNGLLANGLAAARSVAGAGGSWATLELELPMSGQWSLVHHLTEPEVEALVSGIRTSKKLSIAGRVLLLAVLTSFLAWGFWLMRGSRRELIKMAHYDLLTDLPNRRLFFDRMEIGMARAKRNKTRIGLFFIDLAGLNAINDRHGHHGGDLLLKKMAERLDQTLRETDTVYHREDSQQAETDLPAVGAKGQLNYMLCRLGGDEFSVLCEDLHTADDVIAVAERILTCVEKPFDLGDETVEISLNVGAAVYPDDADTAERLLMSADSAMHECKDTHDRYVLFNEDMRLRAERLHLLTLELISAMQKQQFELYYQPKAMLLDGEVVSMEALIRWHHPKLGLITPMEFIPILERNGAIVELGQWIVEQACRDLHRLAAEGFPRLRLGVNVSVRQLKQGNFHDFLGATLRRYKIEPKRLILEITETMVIEDLKKGREAMLALERLGVSLSIDDFGAGYSSLTYLQHLPLSSLKIDKSLIDGMVDERSIHVVQSVINLAQGLSLKTIAEGVETEEQRVLIRKLGCDMIQGYLLSRPLPLADIIEWLNRRQHREEVVVEPVDPD